MVIESGAKPPLDSTRISLVIVDQHLMFAEGLALALDGFEGMEVLAVAGTCAAAVEAVARYRPDVLLLDQCLPDKVGTNCVQAQLEICPDMTVLMVTADGGDDLLSQAIKAGAAGVILKTEPVTALVRAIRAAARGEAIITAGDLRRILSGSENTGLGHDLTGREREVLSLLLLGRSTSALAAELFIAHATARNHIQSIMNKLGAHSRLEAVAIAIRGNVLRAA